MSSSKGVKVSLSAADKFSAVFGRYNKEINTIVEHSEAASRSMERIGARLALGGVLASLPEKLYELPKVLLQRELSLAQLGTNTGLSTEATEQFGKATERVALVTNQRYEDLIANSGQLVKTLGPGGALTALTALGKAAEATGFDLASLSNLSVALRDQFGVAPGGMSEAIGQMILISQRGRASLQDMSNFMMTMGGHAKLLGIQGPQAMGQLGSALQIVAETTNTTQEAAQQLETTIDNLGKKAFYQTLMQLQQTGQIPSESIKKWMSVIKDSNDPLRDALTIMKQWTNMDPTKLRVFFRSADTPVAILHLMKNLDRYVKMQDNLAGRGSDELERRFGHALESVGEQWKRLSTQIEIIGIDVLGPVTDKVAKLLTIVNNHPMVQGAGLLGIVTLLGAGGGLFAFAQLSTTLINIAKTIKAIEQSEKIIAMLSTISKFGLVFTSAGIGAYAGYHAYEKTSDPMYRLKEQQWESAKRNMTPEQRSAFYSRYGTSPSFVNAERLEFLQDKLAKDSLGQSGSSRGRGNTLMDSLIVSGDSASYKGKTLRIVIDATGVPHWMKINGESDTAGVDLQVERGTSWSH